MQAWEKVIAYQNKHPVKELYKSKPLPPFWTNVLTIRLGELAVAVVYSIDPEIERKLVKLAAAVMDWLEEYDG